MAIVYYDFYSKILKCKVKEKLYYVPDDITGFCL